MNSVVSLRGLLKHQHDLLINANLGKLHSQRLKAKRKRQAKMMIKDQGTRYDNLDN